MYVNKISLDSYPIVEYSGQELQKLDAGKRVTHSLYVAYKKLVTDQQILWN